jgi:hypothetical protein
LVKVGSKAVKGVKKDIKKIKKGVENQANNVAKGV